jgi:DNA-binding NarL/FixJ family response regulator
MLRVLVVEERQTVRDGLKRLLAAAGEITVVAEASVVDAAMEIASRLDCDVVILGMAVANRERLDELGRLKAALPGPCVLVVGPAAEAEEAREVLTRGASGYLDISRVREDLVKALRAVCRGSVFVSASAKEPRRRTPVTT